MTTPASLASRILLSLTLALAASTAACGNVIVNGGGSSGGGGGSTSGTLGTSVSSTPGTSVSGTTTVPQAIAVPFSYIMATWVENGGMGASGGNSTEKRLLLGVGNQARSCNYPEPSSTCGTWGLGLLLPPAFQHPGTFPIQYDITSAGKDIVSGNFYEESVSDEAMGFCFGRDIPVRSGTVTILEIDATHVLYTVQGVDESAEYFAVDGTYDAPRC